MAGAAKFKLQRVHWGVQKSIIGECAGAAAHGGRGERSARADAALAGLVPV